MARTQKCVLSPIRLSHFTYPLSAGRGPFVPARRCPGRGARRGWVKGEEEAETDEGGARGARAGEAREGAGA